MAMTLDMPAPAARRGASATAAPDLAERARAFGLARRHTLIVKALRWTLPVGAVVFAAYYAVALTASWQFGPGRLKVGAIEVTPDDLTMKNPSYFGVTAEALATAMGRIAISAAHCWPPSEVSAI